MKSFIKSFLFGVGSFFLNSSFAQMVEPFSVQTQIAPNTVFCVKGSDARPQSFCTDSTPCKIKSGPNGNHTVCLAGTTNPPAGALIISESCWSMKTEYTCMQFNTTCAQYTSNANCTEQGTKQCTSDEQSQVLSSANPRLGGCIAYTRTFECVDPTTTTSTPISTTLSCDVTSSMNGLDWTSTTGSSSNDFLEAVTGQEFARELGLYGSKDGSGSSLFPGIKHRCRDGYAGLKSCCKSSGAGAVTNHTTAIKMQLVGSAFKVGAGYAANVGGRYVFDAVYSTAPEFLQEGLMSMLQSSAGNSWMTAGFGAYGFGTSASAAAGTFASNSASTAIGSIGNTQIYFNPYALAIAVGIQVVMEIISCDQEEKDLSNARSQNLCRRIGSYCSKSVKFLGAKLACLETSDSYCCFNGLLPKAVNEGGRQQLGIGWGTPQNPSCGGLTLDQLSSIDFDTPAMKAAMEPFKKQVLSSYNQLTAPSLKDGTTMTEAKGRANANSSALCLQRKQFDSSTVCN